MAAEPRRSRRADEVIVRDAAWGDRDALVELWRAIEALHARLTPDFFREPAGDGHAVAAVHQALVAARRGGDEAVLVAERAGRVVGFAHLMVYRTPPSPEMVPRLRARLEELFVAEDERRRGAGARLVEAALRFARDRGADQLLLTVWEGNVAAEGFYRAIGFSTVSRVLGKSL